MHYQKIHYFLYHTGVELSVKIQLVEIKKAGEVESYGRSICWVWSCDGVSVCVCDVLIQGKMLKATQ